MERILASAPLITQLSFPSVIDITDSNQWATFSVTLAQTALGANALVYMTFDYIAFGFDIGEDGALPDTFTDSTPDYASSNYEFFGGFAAGKYAIRTLYVFSGSGYLEAYSAADLQSMGFQSSFTVINRHAPPAPTITVDAGPGGLVDIDNSEIHGTAGAGDVVTVTGRREDDMAYELGTAKADADGHWSIPSNRMVDGHYTQVVATADRGGNVSPHSAPLDFYIQQPPWATSVQLAHGTDGVVNAARPLIWGLTDPNFSVTVYDGGEAIATVQADALGWWGVSPATLTTGAHQLTAQVQDQFGRASPVSNAVDVRVATPAAGISFTVGSIDNGTGQAFEVGKLQAALDAVSALVSGMLDDTQSISLKVDIGELAYDSAIAAAGSISHRAASDKASPTVTDAGLTLSPNFAKEINDGKFLTSYVVEVLAHEMLHVLGLPSAEFHSEVQQVGAAAYYHGFNALAINGGPVALTSDAAHIADKYDLMSASHNDYWPYFVPGTAASPYSALDLAILTELGYHNTDAIVSDDGLRHLPGNGKAGHDTVVGHDGRDTLYLEGRAAARIIKTTDAGFSVQDQLGDGGTLQLSSIERLYYSDRAVALDVGLGKTAGMAYRMYQAAFNRTPDSEGLGFWIDHMDRGLSLKAVAGMFKSSPEFTRLYGADLSDSDFVTQLYYNVLHRKPDADGQKFWLDNLQHGLTQADVLTYFSESPENVAQLVGTLQNGFGYDYYRAT